MVDYNKLTENDVRQIIELAITYNYAGFTSEMLNDSVDEMVSHLSELDEEDQENLYYRWLHA